MFYWAGGEWRRDPGCLRQVTEMLWSMPYEEAMEAIARGQKWLDAMALEVGFEGRALVSPVQWMLCVEQDNQACRKAAHKEARCT